MIMDTQDLQRLKNKFDIIGNDPALTHALETAVAVAPTDLTVLISGESGVGKENIPKIIHQYSRRKTSRYLAVNCGAIPEGTINAELFGHEKGAFTGAVSERKGYFEEADGGTLFLDEIGELPKETQAMLLRVLQSGEFMKVGSSKVEKTDVRVIAATNVRLWDKVQAGEFREDLYYRLNGVQIIMPALREKYQLRKVSLTINAISLLKGYRWPGNIRQLKNVTETITALESGPITPGSERVELDADSIRRYIPDEQDTMLPAVTSAAGSGLNEDEKRVLVKAILDLKAEVDRLKMEVESIKSSAPAQAEERRPERIQPAPQRPEEAEWQEQSDVADLSIRRNNDTLIEKALEKHGGNVKLAAEELGVSERTIYRKIAEKKKK